MRVSIKVSKETHLKLLKIATDRKKSLDEIINEAMTKDIYKTERIRQLELEVERLREEFPKPTTESMKDVPCPALIEIPDKGLCCANRAPHITPIPTTKICQFCWERQQKLKTVTSSMEQKPYTMYKKERILCKIGGSSGIWENPNKIQARCERCQKENLDLWTACQKQRADQA